MSQNGRHISKDSTVKLTIFELTSSYISLERRKPPENNNISGYDVNVTMQQTKLSMVF